MLQPIFDSTTIPLLEKVTIFGERRQQVLAGNIANIDTPDYKTRDLPVEAFQKALEMAVAKRRQPKSLGAQSLSARADAGSLDELFPEHLFRATESPAQNVTFQDANNRSIEHQIMKMTKNSLMQNFAIELINAQMDMLQAAISERV